MPGAETAICPMPSDVSHRRPAASRLKRNRCVSYGASSVQWQIGLRADRPSAQHIAKQGEGACKGSRAACIGWLRLLATQGRAFKSPFPLFGCPHRFSVSASERASGWQQPAVRTSASERASGWQQPAVRVSLCGPCPVLPAEIACAGLSPAQARGDYFLPPSFLPASFAGAAAAGVAPAAGAAPSAGAASTTGAAACTTSLAT